MEPQIKLVCELVEAMGEVVVDASGALRLAMLGRWGVPWRHWVDIGWIRGLARRAIFGKLLRTFACQCRLCLLSQNERFWGLKTKIKCVAQ